MIRTKLKYGSEYKLSSSSIVFNYSISKLWLSSCFFYFLNDSRHCKCYFACTRFPGGKTSHWELWGTHILKEAIPGGISTLPVLRVIHDLPLHPFACSSIHLPISSSIPPSLHPSIIHSSIHPLSYSLIQQWFGKHLLTMTLLYFTCLNI